MIELKGGRVGNQNIMSKGALPILEFSFDEEVFAKFFGTANYSNKMRDELKNQLSKMKMSIVFE